MEVIPYFSRTHTRGTEKKTVNLKPVIWVKLNFNQMKNAIVFIGKVKSATLSLEDAFIDFLNDNYFPGAVEDLDTETVEFEYQNFLNTYNK
jgi:prefoldin subunit 5